MPDAWLPPATAWDPGSSSSTATNVIGARPDGWWRDPAAAALRLYERLRCIRRHTRETILLVLDVPHPDLPEGDHDGIEIRYPRRRGRDAADERILELLDQRQDQHVELVTSDRALAAAAIQRGAQVCRTGAFLARLEQLHC